MHTYQGIPTNSSNTEEYGGESTDLPSELLCCPYSNYLHCELFTRWFYEDLVTRMERGMQSIHEEDLWHGSVLQADLHPWSGRVWVANWMMESYDAMWPSAPPARHRCGSGAQKPCLLVFNQKISHTGHTSNPELVRKEACLWQHPSNLISHPETCQATYSNLMLKSARLAGD